MKNITIDNRHLESGHKLGLRCAIYTRKSHEEGLEQEFNSLDAQRDAGEAYIESQKHQGWILLPDHYDDGGFSGGTMDRPALTRLLADIEAGKVDIVVVYKLDRLSRSLLDFIKMIERFNQQDVSFVSVTQQISTTDSTGRMMLNILMTFAQYEREATAERIRDKIAAAKKRGKYCGGMPVYGYDVDKESKKLVVNEAEAAVVRYIFRRYCEHGSARKLCFELNEQGYRTKAWTTQKGQQRGGNTWSTSSIYRTLNNRLYLGKIVYDGTDYPGEHEALIDQQAWDKVHRIFKESKSDKVGVARAKSVAPLRGVIRCGHCKGPLSPTYTHRGNKSYSYYICLTDRAREVSTCPISRIPGNEIENAVFAQLAQILQTPTLIAKTFFALKDIRRDEQERLALQKEQLEIRIEQAMRNVDLVKTEATAPDSDPQVVAVSDDLEVLEKEFHRVSARFALLSKVDVSEADVSSAFRNMDSLWNDLFPEERNRLARLLVKKVEVFDHAIDLVLKTKGLTALAAELAGLTSESMQRKAHP